MSYLRTLWAALRWTAFTLLVLLCVSNVLLPAVARAQFAASARMSVADILAALVGQDISANSYTATASSGSGFSCSSQLEACTDLGPGACNYIGTDASGRVRIGTSCSPEVWIGDGSTRIQPGNVQIINGALFVSGSYIQNSSTGAVTITDTDGLNINATTAITGVIMTSSTIDVTTVTANSCKTQTATVAGVEADDRVFVSPNFNPEANIIVQGGARVTDAGTDEVTFKLCNVAGLDEDPISGSYQFFVIR